MKTATIAMYQFVRLENLLELRPILKQKSLDLGLKGTILIAPEGINCFLFGTLDAIAGFKEFIKDRLNLPKHPPYKENFCNHSPFTRMLVKIKKEIIPMGDPSIRPDEFTAPYLSAQELKSWLDEGRDFVLLDTRNDYEIEVGTFEKATRLGLAHFRKFPEATRTLPESMKDQPIVTFCTGGIRCEKAAAYMLKEGFKNVYQLDGGILKYFEECKDAHYQGDCFVFDWRLAVDSNLAPKLDKPRSDYFKNKQNMKVQSETLV